MTAHPSDKQVQQVGDLLRQRIGLRSEGTFRGRLRRGIADEATLEGGDVAGYIERLCSGGEGLASLVNRVTVQESGFFRHPEHFDVLANSILPGIDLPVRLWSAACANGQEAYSLAMLLEEKAVSGSVVASDLSTDALARTAAARYSASEISGLSPARRKRHLVPDGNGFRISPAVRARVTSGKHNLIDAVPAHLGSCQVVFCRNVLIYLSHDHAKSFLDRLADGLAPGSYLFLGAAESMWQVSDRFQASRLDGTFVYRRRSATSPTPVPASAPAPAPASDATRRPPQPPWRPTAARSRWEPAIAVPQGDGDGDLAQSAMLADSGKKALAAGDHATAVVTFRKWVYLAPDNPMGPFHLGLALEAGGHLTSAQRAFAVARAVLTQSRSVAVEPALEGFAKEELLKLLDAKQVLSR